MFALSIITFLFCLDFGLAVKSDWYRNALVYQVYPRSFKDSNGDGIGDLNGITSKLEHIVDIGADVVWLSPIYKSPQVDFGYDISNFTDIHPEYGTLEDFDKLLTKAKSLGLKVILDFVPNHSSDEHPWFRKSKLGIKPYDDYYVWRDAKHIVSGPRVPPNNWLSNFDESAWEWDDNRKQFYLHQFATGQPDFNYRNPTLNREIKDILMFWINRGVDGFRIDAINHMFEDARFLDEPWSNRTDVPTNEYESLLHVYTKDQNETYDVLKSWKTFLDDHSNRTQSDRKMILTEAYTTHDLTIKYYNYGSTVPFNFMFIVELNNRSTAADFKRLIDRWVSHVPKGAVANWVVGNHDKHRVATRFGSKRADQISMLTMILPGVTIVYNGDEIGMEDRWFSYEETIDTAGLNAGPGRYYLKSRDPERTPFQWDDTTSAGFSSNPHTWLPVHDNYKTLNLAAQKRQPVSHYKVFKALSALKKTAVIAEGSLNVAVLDETVFGVARRLGSKVVVLLINFSSRPVTVNPSIAMDLPSPMTVYTASVGSGVQPGSRVNSTMVTLPDAASVVYTSGDITF